jgi:large-conductance mechanosensitive channel
MFKVISFVAQLLMLKKTLTKSSSALDYIEKASDRVRGYFLFAVGTVIAVIFLLVALIVTVIGIGTQIEQHGYVSFNGLMISATIFLVIAVVIFLISVILLSVQKQKMAERKRLKEQMAEQSSMKPLMEEILKQILVNLTTPKSNPAEGEQPKSTPKV